MWHRLSHLNTRYEPYNEQYIAHGHRVYCCINCVLVFALFTIILLLAYRYPAFTMTTTGPHKNWNRQNLVNFQRIEPKLGRVFIRISRTIWFGRSIVRFCPGTVFKKSVCVWKYCLVKPDLNCTVHHITCPVITLLYWWLGRHVNDTKRYNPL